MSDHGNYFLADQVSGSSTTSTSNEAWLVSKFDITGKARLVVFTSKQVMEIISFSRSTFKATPSGTVPEFGSEDVYGQPPTSIQIQETRNGVAITLHGHPDELTSLSFTWEKWAQFVTGLRDKAFEVRGV